MTLEKTINNLRETKNSFFNLNSGNFLTHDLIKKSLVIWFDNREFNLTYLDYDGNYNYENYKYLKTLSSDQIQIYKILKKVPF